jgi:hypothetical protein
MMMIDCVTEDDDLLSCIVSVLATCRLPFTLITADVAEATAACLLAQAEEAERQKMPPVVQERLVIEEFGRCLMQIIDSANKTKGKARRFSCVGETMSFSSLCIHVFSF